MRKITRTGVQRQLFIEESPVQRRLSFSECHIFDISSREHIMHPDVANPLASPNAGLKQSIQCSAALTAGNLCNHRLSTCLWDVQQHPTNCRILCCDFACFVQKTILLYWLTELKALLSATRASNKSLSLADIVGAFLRLRCSRFAEFAEKA